MAERCCPSMEVGRTGEDASGSLTLNLLLEVLWVCCACCPSMRIAEGGEIGWFVGRRPPTGRGLNGAASACFGGAAVLGGMEAARCLIFGSVRRCS